MIGIHPTGENHRNRHPLQRRCLIIFLWLFYCGFIRAVDQLDLTEIPLEELMRIQVTLASRHAEQLSNVAAAIYVLTYDDIIQSGCTTIQDALRMVPGMEVARVDANKWAISVRGFNNLVANKLLVLIDGRTIYNPVYSGVLWDAQDVLLEDVKQIEVIRGPGGSLWGANAVNGVINIVTKKAEDTHGGYLTLGGGTEEERFGAFRYGGVMGKMHYRTFVKYFKRSDFVDSQGESMADHWDMARTGLRMDGPLTEKDNLTVTADYFQNNVGNTLYLQDPNFIFSQDYRTKTRGGHILSRLHHTQSNQMNWTIQMYLDAYNRQDPMLIGGQLTTFDIDFQQSLLFNKQHIMWGVGFRETTDKIQGSQYIQMDPDKRSYAIASLFIQDELFLFNDQWHLVFGSKFEYNEMGGLEIQPSLRGSYRMKNKKGVLWWGISRAVRTLSRSDKDIQSYVIVGNPDAKSEELLAFEMGGRHQLSRYFLMDISAYYNHYDRLSTYEPLIEMNKRRGRILGVELAMDVQCTSWMKIRSAYSYANAYMCLDAGSQDPWGEKGRVDIPNHQCYLQANMNVGRQCQWTLNARYVDALSGPRIKAESYVDLHSKLAYYPDESVELSVVGQNLLQSRHIEYPAEWIPYQYAEISRGIYVQMKWWF